MGIIVIGGTIFIVGFLAIVAAIPMWSARSTRRIWVVGVSIAALALAIAFWPRRATGPGYFVVFNQSGQPVIVQVRTPLGTGRAFRLEPHQYGPMDYGWSSGTEVLIFAEDCHVIATSHIEGRYRGTVLKADLSTEVVDLGDIASSDFAEVDACAQPAPTAPAGA